MANNFFTICSLFYAILLAIVYFFKKRLKSFENRMYSGMIIANLIVVLLAVSCYFCILYKDFIPILNDIVSKTLLIGIFTWTTIFTIYVFYISSKDKTIIKIKENLPLISVIIGVAYLIIVILTGILPLYYHNTNMIVYSFGPSANLIYVLCTLYMFFWLFLMIKNYKNVKNKKYLPVITFMISMLIVMIIQKLIPGLLLITATETFITFLMYFTIENPDMQLINDLNIAREQAEKANHAKTDFLSSMSHEIRTPLNAIVGFSQVLVEEDIPDNAKEEIKDIVSASLNLLDIVNGILDISKIEANKLEIINKEYDFRKIIEEVTSLTKVRIGDKPIEFLVKTDDSIPPILYGDNIRLKQIVLNILTNAAKYTKQGHIHFTVHSVIKEDVCRLIFNVEDSGIGIKQEDIDKLFTKFQRFDTERNTTIEGTGLGLAITKKLVELMGGNIVVHSVYEEGTKFTIAIDQKIIPKQILEAPHIEMKEIDVTGKSILVVDDNVINLKVAERLLKNYNVNVVKVESGQACIDKIKNGEEYDLILLDDMMPQMNGVETYHKLKEIQGFSIPTVMLTANAISGMKEKYLADGFDDYLAKPIDKIELNRVIDKFLNTKK